MAGALHVRAVHRKENHTTTGKDKLKEWLVLHQAYNRPWPVAMTYHIRHAVQ